MHARRPTVLTRVEDWFSFILLVFTSVLAIVGVFSRLLGLAGIRGLGGYVQHLVIWIAFAGGAVTSREGRHLALTYGLDFFGEKVKSWVRTVTSTVDTFFLTVLTVTSLSFTFQSFGAGTRVGAIPIQALVLVMPLGFLLMTVRAALGSSSVPARRLIPLVGVLGGLVYGMPSIAALVAEALGPRAGGPVVDWAARFAAAVAPAQEALHLPLVVLLILSTLVGTPIFVLLGGLAVLFFTHAGGSLEVVTNEAYTMLSGSIIPALPLFTVAGFIISESKAGERLVRVFKALFGWLPGGVTVVGILICAFLTTFTGASGVTILAVGGLLFYILTTAGYRKEFATGLLTASGSIGLLFPPSLPVIMYGVVAQVSIKEMFVGGFLPGVFMVLALAAMGIVASMRQKVPRSPFNPRELLPKLSCPLGELVKKTRSDPPEGARAAREEIRAAILAIVVPILEILLPVLVILFYLKGVMTLVETAAYSVLHAFVVEVVLAGDIKWRDVPQVFLKSALIMGGVLVILSVAKGLSYYIVDVEFPTRLADWLHAAVSSKFVFLILLNLALIVVGCFMDIYSAITVVVPLIVPLGIAYGVHPVHLGIIFLANLELGYLTPPGGINLFLSSYRFNEPLARIYKVVIPFLLVLLATVLVITYVPWITTGLLKVIRL